jgi:hypothetical protein
MAQSIDAQPGDEDEIDRYLFGAQKASSCDQRFGIDRLTCQYVRSHKAYFTVTGSIGITGLMLDVADRRLEEIERSQPPKCYVAVMKARKALREQEMKGEVNQHATMSEELVKKGDKPFQSFSPPDPSVTSDTVHQAVEQYRRALQNCLRAETNQTIKGYLHRELNKYSVE